MVMNAMLKTILINYLYEALITLQHAKNMCPNFAVFWIVGDFRIFAGFFMQWECDRSNNHRPRMAFVWPPIGQPACCACAGRGFAEQRGFSTRFRLYFLLIAMQNLCCTAAPKYNQ